MHRQPNSLDREAIVADAIKEVVSELRMVDVTYYVAFIHLERFANVADIVDSAAELYFQPGTLKLGNGGEVHLDWTGSPKVVLDLELKPSGATVYFTLGMTDKHASVDVNYVSFDEPSPEPEDNTAFLQVALEQARIRKTEGLRMAG
ncbi:MAG: hypothetical protein KF849_11835 [Rhizobiaceae bacterium]|nr:hypothetical protein [Rhizobiaceae bacterium]